MNRLFLPLLALLCLVHAESIAQRPGDVRWTLRTDLSIGADSIRSIKVQADGKIVAAGISYKGGFRSITVGRYNGQIPDSSFGINGVAKTSLDSAHATADDMELQSDGKIVVAGGYYKGIGGEFILARYNQDGTADSSFGMNGIVRTDFGSSLIDVASAVAIQTDGKIIAAGRSGSWLALCRYNTDGSLDSSFDSDGKLATPATGATCMKLQTDGKILICCGGTVVRLMPDGSQDYSFGTNGVATLLNGIFRGMAIQKDGKILVSGNSTGWFLERLDTAGVHDNSFGNGGVVKTTGFYNGSNQGQSATSVCLQADGRIIASGRFSGSQSVYMSFAIVRYQSNGAPDTSFGTLGKVGDFNLFPNFFRAASLSAAINNSGELILAGTCFDVSWSTGQWALASYYLGPMLAVPTISGVAGQIIVAPNPAEDFARIQSAHIANCTWHLSICDLTGRILYSEKVVVTNGVLDKSISLGDLPPALYLVKLDNGVSKMTVKLTKSR